MSSVNATFKLLFWIVLMLGIYLAVAVLGWGGFRHLAAPTIVAITFVAGVSFALGWFFGSD